MFIDNQHLNELEAESIYIIREVIATLKIRLCYFLAVRTLWCFWR